MVIDQRICFLDMLVRVPIREHAFQSSVKVPTVADDRAQANACCFVQRGAYLLQRL